MYKTFVTHMKKIILLLILFVSLLSFDKSNKNEKFTESQLTFIMENYNWKSEELLIVNFRQPSSRCHYDNYRNLNKPSKWWTDFYTKINLKNIKNIFVYSDQLKAKKIIDSKSHFADSNSFFLSRVFSKDKTCYGIIVINNDGEFRKKAGEYMPKDVERLISELK